MGSRALPTGSRGAGHRDVTSCSNFANRRLVVIGSSHVSWCDLGRRMASTDNELDGGIHAIADALAWALAHGWSTSHADLEVAGCLWHELEAMPLSPELRGERFLERLLEAYEASGQAATHRAILARLVLHVSGIDQ